jgi:hypothetical protein
MKNFSKASIFALSLLFLGSYADNASAKSVTHHHHHYYHHYNHHKALVPFSLSWQEHLNAIAKMAIDYNQKTVTIESVYNPNVKGSYHYAVERIDTAKRILTLDGVKNINTVIVKNKHWKTNKHHILHHHMNPYFKVENNSSK